MLEKDARAAEAQTTQEIAELRGTAGSLEARLAEQTTRAERSEREATGLREEVTREEGVLKRRFSYYVDY